MTKTQVIVPGVVVANADIDIDGGDYEDLTHVDLVTLTEGAPNTLVVTAQTIVAKGTTAPGVGEASLQDKDTLRLGDATTVSDFLIIVGITLDEALKVD